MSLLRVTLPAPRVKYWTVIPGEPRPWKRVGRGKYGHSFNASEKEQKNIAWEVRAAFPAMRLDSTNFFGVRCLFYCSPVRLVRIKARTLHAGLTYKRKNEPGDLDNFVKNVLDACTGLIWANDNQVDELFALALTAGSKGPRTEVMFYPIDAEYLTERAADFFMEL